MLTGGLNGLNRQGVVQRRDIFKLFDAVYGVLVDPRWAGKAIRSVHDSMGYDFYGRDVVWFLPADPLNAGLGGGSHICGFDRLLAGDVLTL